MSEPTERDRQEACDKIATDIINRYPHDERAKLRDAIANALLSERKRAVGLAEALKGVVRVADRKTVEFDEARDALAEYEKGTKG